MVLGMIVAAGVTFLLTGAASYFVFKSPAVHNTKSTLEAAGTIKNSVTIEESSRKTDVLVLYIVSLLIILVLFKFIELAIFMYNALRRTIKKKYTRYPQVLPAAAAPAVPDA